VLRSRRFHASFWRRTISALSSDIVDAVSRLAEAVFTNSRSVAFLLGDRLAGAARLFREVLELGEAILHAQHGRLVVDVQCGCERKRRDRRRVDADQVPLRVPRQHMAAADLAPLPIGALVLVVLPEFVVSLGHLHRLGLPERECVDRAGGPAPAGVAMAVASAHRIACDDNRDSATEALPFRGFSILAHEFSPSLEGCRDIARAVSRDGERVAFHAKRRFAFWRGTDPLARRADLAEVIAGVWRVIPCPSNAPARASFRRAPTASSGLIRA